MLRNVEVYAPARLVRWRIMAGFGRFWYGLGGAVGMHQARSRAHSSPAGAIAQTEELWRVVATPKKNLRKPEMLTNANIRAGAVGAGRRRGTGRTTKYLQILTFSAPGSDGRDSKKNLKKPDTLTNVYILIGTELHFN